MGQDLVIPESFKGKTMAPAFAAVVNAQEDSLAEGIGQSYPVIGYKGKVWSLRHRGERHNFVRPDDGTPQTYLDVIVLGQAKLKSKSFYKKYDPNTSDGDRPICSSMDGLVPDLDVTAKQCDSCALCPRNVWKTDPTTGRKGRECTDYKRLAVLVLPTQTKPMLGEALMEPCFLRVPPASLNSLAIMGENMANQGYHYSSYITRISFDPNEAHPKMVFRPLQGLSDQEAPVIIGLMKDPNVGRITGGDVILSGPKPVVQVQAPGTAATGLAAPSPSPAAPPPPTTIVMPAPPAATQASSSATAGYVPPATPPTPAPAPETGISGLATTTTGPVDTGFGGAALASQTASAVQGSTAPAVGATVADTGEPEAADADLDARIASLIAK